MSRKSRTDAHLDILGKTVRDRVTGFAGVVSSISFDLYGCVQAAVSPPLLAGKLEDGRWFDIHRLLVTDEARVMPVPEYGSTPAEHTHGPAEKPAGGIR